VGANLAISPKVVDGTVCSEMEPLVIVEGSMQWLLSLERIWLNFLQRLSGISTKVHQLKLKHPKLHLLDTRKTTPGWRVLEKYAVLIGGGTNHRLSLGDMILIKNNHLDAAGVTDAEKSRVFFERIRARKPWHTPIECEVRSLAELQIVLAGSPDFILLDNMDDHTIRACMDEIARLKTPSSSSPVVEVSGGVTSDSRLTAISELGIKYVSMGSLTTNVRSVDISARVKFEKKI
jgi:nicotinate-nucleotide pyrophosphorylase (carboxylating)